jgi:outer membrane protein TolC
MKPARYFFLFSWLFFAKNLNAQADTLRLSLEEVVTLAQNDAPDALIAETQMKTSYWSYRTYQADYKPLIALTGTLPDLNRSIQAVTQPDGTDIFVQRSQMRNGVGLSLQQQIAPTGGILFARTGLERLDIFQSAASNKVSYFSTPIAIGFRQPIIAYNNLKWNKRIEPLRYQEATREYAEKMENIALNVTSLFFEVFIAQLNYASAKRDKANADTLYEISKGRFEVGRIAETELLQIELSAMNSDAFMQQSLLALQTGTERLRNFLGIKKAIAFSMEEPVEIPQFQVDPTLAMQYAKANRSETIQFERRLVEADARVAEAKAQSGFQFDIEGAFSLSQTAGSLDDAYRNPLDNEVLSLNLRIPIFDWGKAKALYETANSLREVERMSVGQEQVNFEQEIILKVKQFDLLRKQVALAQRAYEVSVKREEMTRNRYYIGKIGVTDLNIAVGEKESARKGYMDSLRAFWLSYYDLRQATMYDFERQVPLVKRVEGY